MMDTLLYILEANLYLAIFALFYFFALRKEKHYLANRVVLISSFFLAWLIPGLSILDPVSSVLPTIGLESITISPNALADSPTLLSFSFEAIIVTVYCLGVLVGFLVFFARLMRILAVLGNDSIIVDQRLKIVNTDGDGAWSFFNLIALGKDIPLKNRDWIMEHEKVHATEKHSIDKLLIQLVKIFGWFNPATYYFEFALEENHEFRADQVVCEKFSDSLIYSQVLISQSLSGVPFNLLGHSFSKKSLLKSRIQMINQTKQTGKMKYLLSIPVLAVALLFQNGTKADVHSESVSTPLSSVITAQKGGDEVYQVVDKMPEFKGGLEGLFKFISNNTIYPKSSSKSDESGKVFVQFIIDKSGNVIDPQVIDAKSVKSNSLRRAALETVGKMPAWTPGEHEGKKVKVQLTLPIKFELE